MKPGYMFICLSVMLISACAPQAELVKTRTDVSDLRADVKAMKSMLEEYKRRLEDIEANVKATVNVQQVMADTGSRFDQLATDMQLIQGKIEENNFRISELGQKLDDKAFKLSELAAKVEELEAKIKATSGETPSPDKDKNPTAKPLEPSEAFRQAKDDYNKGSFELALAGFENYLKQFPDASQADEAMYWIAESHYAMHRYDKAIETYTRLIKTYPQSSKVPAAKLKTGLSYLNEKNTAKAKEFLKKVMKEHPNSKEAALAKEKLGKISK